MAGYPEALRGIRMAWWTDLELTFNINENRLGKVWGGWLPQVMKMKESSFSGREIELIKGQ